MKGVNFIGAQIIMGAPPGDEDKIGGLPVRRIEEAAGTPYGAWVSVWQPSDYERKVIANGGVVELQILSEVHPPISVNTLSGSVVVEND